MSLSIGIVGLPNTGKSTLFNALLKKQAALAASYPFATIEPNVGVVAVPDDNLDKLFKIAEKEYSSQKETEKKPPEIVPATIKFYDIAGLVEGAHQGEGLGNQFLSHIREVSAILHLVRGFDDENVPRAGSVSPQKDIDLINTELLLADIQTIERRLNSKRHRQHYSLLQKIKENLEKGILAKDINLDKKEETYLREMHLLTSKPVLYVLNVSEQTLGNNNIQYLRICAKVEAELAGFNCKERVDYLKELGIIEPGLNKIIKKCYELLNLQTYYTYGDREVRAWTIEKGTNAVEAAGIIHTDFAKGFIKAETISVSELLKAGSWREAKEKGKMRLEGREYLMQEGDVVVFRFNL